ncbi:hypothetical protein VDG1235_414 [Verrucomicrobiia bacterium DG1235]|nr:hypothetical protein VDG1235_414 [Verrucomicrobiae bacterium DG1235]
MVSWERGLARGNWVVGWLLSGGDGAWVGFEGAGCGNGDE